ncbi:MAG: hypothetical protein ACI82I_003420 [Gammaproteobacteria bacterium]|jgi:hypothetical protein
MIHDISNGLRLLTFRSPSNGSFSNSARAALVAIVVYLTVRLFGLAVQSWPIGGYEFWDIPNFLAILFIEFGVLLSILAAFGLGKGLVQAIIAYIAVNGGVKTFHWGGAKVGHLGARAFDRVALI